MAKVEPAVKEEPDLLDVYVVTFGGAPAQSIDKIRFPMPSLNYYVVLDLSRVKNTLKKMFRMSIFIPH